MTKPILMEYSQMSNSKSGIDKELNKPAIFFFMRLNQLLFGSKKMGILTNSLLLKAMAGNNIDGLDCEERYIPGKNDDAKIRVRIFKPKNNDKKLPAMVYSHGGGYRFGVPEMSSGFFKRYIETRPCVIIAPDYRKSLEYPYPIPFNDCYDTLLWAKENADSLGILPNKFILAGHSAGGGATAALALKARDTGDVHIAFQMPCYPMLDFRLQTESVNKMKSMPILNSKDVANCWDLYLSNANGSVSPYASPSIAEEFKGLPPTISFIGELDPLRDETIDYINRLKSANIPVKFKVFRGGYHGFEAMFSKARISETANQFQYDAFAEYYDKYIT